MRIDWTEYGDANEKLTRNHEQTKLQTHKQLKWHQIKCNKPNAKHW